MKSDSVSEAFTTVIGLDTATAGKANDMGMLSPATTLEAARPAAFSAVVTRLTSVRWVATIKASVSGTCAVTVTLTLIVVECSLRDTAA